MASKPPTTSFLSNSIPGIKHLIVDSSPLLTSPLSSLRGMAQSYLVTSDVVLELRDKKGREVMREAELQLGLPGDGGLEGGKAGFLIREPTLESIAKVTAFARKTGDIAVLSLADIRVLALCLTLELEENGTWRVRDTPGQILTGPPAPPAVVEEVGGAMEKLEIKEEVVEEETPVASTSNLDRAEDDVVDDDDDSPLENEEEQDEVVDELEGEGEGENEDDDDNVSEVGSDDSHLSSSSWITPDNLVAHKVKDLGLFTIPTPEEVAAKPAKSILKAAVLTGDFAMQNVALQMGLNVLGSGGKRVREVRTWVLRCHGCFKICKNPEKRFCPSCGGPTLIRTSITYVTATPENPKGYVLHLKANFQYRLRGTQYSIPNPKMGRAGGGAHSELVLREDQKEWARGVKTAEMIRSKETRAMLRAVMDDKDRREKGLGKKMNTGAIGGIGGWNDPDWQPAMNLGEGSKGRRRGGGGKNGGAGEIKVDKSGMPVIGSGRKNTNESRRRHQ